MAAVQTDRLCSCDRSALWRETEHGLTWLTCPKCDWPADHLISNLHLTRADGQNMCGAVRLEWDRYERPSAELARLSRRRGRRRR